MGLCPVTANLEPRKTGRIASFNVAEEAGMPVAIISDHMALNVRASRCAMAHVDLMLVEALAKRVTLRVLPFCPTQSAHHVCACTSEVVPLRVSRRYCFPGSHVPPALVLQ